MIEISDLSFSYRAGQPLFDGLHLSLPAGNIYGLLGKNGAGKSTLLKLLGGLLFPQQGALAVLGGEPQQRLPALMRELYFVSEEGELPSMSVQRYLKLYSPFYPRFSEPLFLEYAQELELPLDRKLSSLSFGQKKKFLLSFGLATDCKLLILDEPTNGLDIPSKSQFRKTVARAIHEERAFIISTHQARDMENLIDPIIILDQGRVVFYQSYEQIAAKLSVSRQPSLPDPEHTIYAESHLGGYTVVEENLGFEETNMNLELLFNAVISNPQRIHEIFNR